MINCSINKKNCWFIKIFTVFNALFILSCFPIHANNFTDQVDGLFQKWDNTHSPGLVVGIIKDGTLIYQKTYGMANLTHGVPLTTSTIFNMGSNSKQFTAFCIYLLEAEGKLSLEDDIRKYIPEVPDFGSTITIQQLIYHTSGLRDYLELMSAGGWNLLDDLVTKDQALALVSRQKALNFPVGSRFLYCNTGYLLLAEIVARVSKETFPEFTQQRIFKPLGMKSSLFHDFHYNIVPHLADSYMLGPDSVYYNFPFNTDISGESGLHSNLDDLTKWDQNFYNPIVGSSTIIEKMLEPGKLRNGSKIDYSSALFVSSYNSRQVIFHGGDLAGFHSNIVRFPEEQLTILTMSNTFELQSNNLLDYSFQIADKYFVSLY